MNDVNSLKCFLKRWILRLHFLYSQFHKIGLIFIYLFISKPNL